MKPAIIVALLIAVLAVACQPQQSTAAYSSAGAAVNVFLAAPQGNVPLTSPSTASNVTVYNSNGTRNVTITIYGHNATSTIVEVISEVSNGTKYSKNNSFTGVDCVTLNQSVGTGSVTIGYLSTGDTLATFNTSATFAYNAVQYNGSNYACPGVIENSTVFNVGTYSEYALFTSCDVVKTTNISFSYFVSPDNSKWFPGAVSLQQCNNTNTVTQLTDKSANFIKLSVNQADVRGNRPFVKLVAK